MNDTTRDLDAEGAAWAADANTLGAFVMAELVNRRDVWGGYLPMHRREAGADKVRTCPPVAKRGHVALSRLVLYRHFVGRDVGDVIGLHAMSASDMARFGAFDFDAHGGGVDLLALEHAVTWCTERLAEFGLGVLIEDSDGGGGAHLWVRFDAPVDGASLFALLTHIASTCHAATGVRPETFPKQPSTRGAFGNWLRLPGRHHTRAHWSRLARPGTAWSVGRDAVACLLEWPASSAEAVPPADAWPSQRTVLNAQHLRISETTSRPTCTADSFDAARVRDALAYLDADDYHTWLRVGLALKSTGDAAGWPLWCEWSQRSAKFDDDAQARKWSSLTPRDITIASLFYEAQQRGWQPVTAHDARAPRGITTRTRPLAGLADPQHRALVDALRRGTIGRAS
ncbi:MAG: PriCT-2 domain-containing protein [Gemmatimonadaceae bacterium]|nr:PriCT-2 domain-containing protein [Gemmatimonadaceae bacterium]